jgi:CDP-diacylglycerol--serine O-phosphatidyltransferase
MIRKHIPNFITCLNVISGSLAVLFAIKGELTLSVILIIAAAIFDFFDGVAARLLKAYSPLGKELDSLADMISFGLAPGMLMMVMQEYAIFGINVRAESFTGLSLWEITCISASLLIPIFSALRLAKFNIDTRQTNSFIGLPTPDAFILQPFVLLFITVSMSLLLVSEFPMFSLKFKNFSWKDNRVRFIFLTISIAFIFALNIYGIAASIVSFILISVFRRIKK